MEVLGNNVKGDKTKSNTDNNLNELSLEDNAQRSIANISNTTENFLPQLMGISQILPSLYLCGASSITGKILQQLSINFVINVAAELPDTPLHHNPNHAIYLRINVLDRPDVDLFKYFDKVADLVEAIRHNGGKTLLHCVAGVSRSTTLCLAYLMKYKQMSLKAAYQHIKAIRPQIRPNTGFFQQLIKYEESIMGSRSVNMIFYECLQREIPDVYGREYQAMEEFYQCAKKSKHLQGQPLKEIL